MNVNLAGREVGHDHPVYIIAEGGVTNWGKLDLAKKQVDAAVEAGCDAVKFQAQTTEALVSKKVDPYWFDRMKYKEIPYPEIKELKAYCEKRGIRFFITAHTDVDLDFIDKELEVPFFKVGGGEVTNHDFLRNVASRGKPIIMSTGLLETIEEVEEAVAVVEKAGCKEIVILHCNTIYPTPPAQDYLGFIGKLKRTFDYPIGYSDHSVGMHLPLAAVALGACVIEKHISFDKTDERSLDCAGSLLPEEWPDFVSRIRDIEAALGEPGPEYHKSILKGKGWAQQSIVASRDIRKGETIAEDMLAYKRPGGGIPPSEKERVIGKKAVKDIDEDALVALQDLK
jgi:N,N'-diacetyllegionaminate synthase